MSVVHYVGTRESTYHYLAADALSACRSVAAGRVTIKDVNHPDFPGATTVVYVDGEFFATIGK
jgi:hypothetical protein